MVGTNEEACKKKVDERRSNCGAAVRKNILSK